MHGSLVAESPAPQGVNRLQVAEPTVTLRSYLWYSSVGLAAVLAHVVMVLLN